MLKKDIRGICMVPILTFLFTITTWAQIPVKLFDEKDFDAMQFSEFTANKRIPKEIYNQALIALSYYPELRDTKIIFRLRKRKTPLASRPRIWSVFKKRKNRTYIITISKKLSKQLSSILFHKLPYNAQVGVLGHELGHTTYYNTKNTFQLIGLSFNLLKSRNVDEFEFNTDRICILHGLGYQLYDWSTYVRKALHIEEWRGADDPFPKKDAPLDQRYMNPETIKKYMEGNTIYRHTS